MSNNIQQEELLKQLRAVIFSGSNFTESIIKKYTGQYKGIDIGQSIDKAKNQMEAAALPDIGFDKIVQLHESRDRITLLIAAHPEYLLNELNGDKNEKVFEYLSAAFEKDKQEKDKISGYVKYLEDRARKMENKDAKDKLFETVRVFAQWCKDFLLNSEKYESLYPVLTTHYSEIIRKISGISKVGINIMVYRDLAEECYDVLLQKNVNNEQSFQRILALINLRCRGLKIEIPSVNIMTTCPKCGDKEQSGAICTKCGAYINCPGCKHKIAKDSKICGGCGIETENIEQWMNKINEAGKKISIGDYESAEQLINHVKTKWSANAQVMIIVNTIAELRTKVADYEKIINDCIAKSYYFTAQRQIEEVKLKVVLSDNLRIKEKDIRAKIEHVKKLVDTGDRQSDPVQKTNNYSQAISFVADFSEAINKLKSQNITIANLSCRTGGKIVQLSWEKINCNSLAIKYIIYREDITDGKSKAEISQTSATTCTDTIRGGISYFYYVQIQYNVNGTDISGVWNEVKSQEVIIPEEVSDYRVTAGNKSVRIEFTPNPNAVNYELHKTDETREKKIIKANLRNGSYTDTEVKNDVRYTYKLIAVFKNISGEIIRSQGIEMYATPLIPPEPVQILEHTKNGEVVTLSWDRHGKSNDCFRILHTVNSINRATGFSMPLSELEKSGKITIPSTFSKIECVLSDHTVKNYFSIWSVFGDIAIAGAEIEVLNVTEVSNAKTYISSGKLYVEWDWPSNCNQVRISYSNEGYNDAHKIMKNYPRELYDRQKAFVIEPVLNKDYYIEVATSNFEGKKEIISSGIRMKLENSNPMTIKYSVKTSTFFGKKLTLTIENDNSKRLPELILVSSPNRIPARKEDGTAIHVIAGGTACGTVELSNEHIKKNYYARLFLVDNAVKNIKIITPDKEYLKLY